MRILPSVAVLVCLALAACSEQAQPAAEAAGSAAAPASTAQLASATPVQAPAADTADTADRAQAPANADPAAAREMDARVERVLGEAPAYRAMVASLKRAVAAEDAAAVAAMVHYPLQARIGGTRIEVKDAAQFQAQYAQLMVPEITRAIAGQDYDAALVNQQGIMLGDGQVWISGVCAREDCSDHPAPQVVTLQTTAS
ncbi:hypothetical protein [Pseudoxanthomonas composti]|uniref:Uncharacterized protein n=1 Tax=Pseudoxanthomonas composti TaxID=2137479 RepID=A0A4Q1JYV8_9GAMM|nr:hypothetical protein [Pseudoxanthomonas composti]RXR06614.1 hypothetical protein EPA99_08235 [Pseudoxanthomonas composti]